MAAFLTLGFLPSYLETDMKQGERYISNVWMDADHNPLRIKVTRVTKHSIYYRPDYGLHEDGSEWLGSPHYINNTPDSIERWIGPKWSPENV